MLEKVLIFNFIDLTKSVSIFFLTLISMATISFFTKHISVKGLIPKYVAPQKIHKGEVSRLGGLIMYLAIFFLILISSFQEFKLIILYFLLSFLPLALITLAEDFNKPSPPWIRLIVMFFSSWLILNMTNIQLPIFDNPLLKDILAEPIIQCIFYSFCLVGLMNGMNFIDGVNGNLSFLTIAMLTSLGFLAFIVDDFEFISLLILSCIPLLAFVLINYPLGKIFAGDLGAYFYGALVGFLIIFFFGRHEDISAGNALLITFYPIIELIYSTIRKICKGKSPMEPDTYHLHFKIYTILYLGTKKPRLANNLVTLFLVLFWLVPTMILPWVYQSHFLLVIFIILLTLCYITVNLIVTLND